jgi:hypothetical protein
VNANYEAGTGMSVGQAHLLDDVISLVGIKNITAFYFSEFHSLSLTKKT